MLNNKSITTDSKLAKTFGPGNIKAKLVGIQLVEPGYDKESFPYHLVYQLEGVEQGPEFEGFLKDANNPQGERYKGQIGAVKASYWAFKDGVTKTGNPVSRNNGILTALTILAKALGKNDALNQLEASTIEEYVAQASDLLKGDKFLNWCIAGKEYLNKKNYINYDMFLPRSENGRYPFEDMGASPSKVITFNEATHIIKLKTAPAVQNFGPGGDNADLANSAGAVQNFEAPGAQAGGKTDDFDLPF